MQQREVKKFPLASMFYQDLYQKAQKTREKLLKTFEEMSKQFDGIETIVPALKSFERTKEKIDVEYRGDWKKITDIVRGTISFQTKKDLENGMELFRKKFTLHNIKDRFTNPTKAGYRDILALFKDPETGIVGEIQFNLCPILKVKDKAHAIYEQIQTIERNAKKESRELTKGEREKLELLFEKSKKLYQEAFDKSTGEQACSIKD